MRKEKDDLFERWIEELSYAEKSRSENFKTPRALPPPFNMGDNYGGASLTADNKEMFITICKPGLNGYNNCDIYKISRRNGMWGELENLGPNINTEDGWESQPSISADGQTLFFATARANSKKMDIYYSNRNADGTWQAAKAVENGINTEGNEKSPFIHSDSQTLYFSSDGHTGVGGFDIFYTRQDEKKQWIKPKNLGIPINTEKDEAGFFVSTDGKTGYFSSNFIKGAGGWDIFQFDLYEKARPQNIVFLKGTVKDPSGSEIKNATVELKNTETKETIEVKVDSIDGKYVAVMAVKKPADLVLTVKEPGKVPQIKLIPKEIEQGKPIKIENEIKPPKKGETYTINDIKYKSNSSELTTESKFVLDEFALYLKSNTKIKIQIQGHTDDVGDDKNNMALSSDRAFTVMQYLQNTGIEGKRLSFMGFGETKPLLPNTSDENRAKNRRTEFIILD
jgi:outer membrane protein OmpA-like peptidoglycan-associated protein